MPRWNIEWDRPLRGNPGNPADPMSVQSILFPLDRYTVEEAQVWLRAHGYTGTTPDVTADYIRMRQRDPPKDGICRTVEFGKGIKAVVCRP